MEFEIFSEELKNTAKQIEIELTNKQIEKYYNYMNLLLKWNEKINLTAIVEPKEIILKHFVDSLTIAKYVKENDNMVDVGTGAGFPGIPLAIVKEKNNIILLDSLNKRIKFLEEVKEKLKLENIRQYMAEQKNLEKTKKKEKAMK